MTLTPALVLSAVVAGASTAALLSARERSATGTPTMDPSAQVMSEAVEPGSSGRSSERPRNSSRWLGPSGRPHALPGPADPEARPPVGSLDVPAPLLAAYRDAADRLATSSPECALDWSVLASIGRVESGHARSGRIDEHGTAAPAIFGPRLTGAGDTAEVADTDHGRWDGDPVWDRAMGSMQFIPSTWRKYGTDGDDDGVADPQNVHDAARTAGEYLCSGGGELRDPRAVAAALFRYSHSEDYVRTVLLWADAYGRAAVPGAVEILPVRPPAAAPPSTEDEVHGGRPMPEEPAVVAVPPRAVDPPDTTQRNSPVSSAPPGHTALSEITGPTSTEATVSETPASGDVPDSRESEDGTGVEPSPTPPSTGAVPSTAAAEESTSPADPSG